MNTIVANRMVDNYFRFIRYWDDNSKNELINKLTASISLKSNIQSDFSSCFGAWEDTRSGEEIADEIKAERVNQKDFEGF